MRCLIGWGGMDSGWKGGGFGVGGIRSERWKGKGDLRLEREAAAGWLRQLRGEAAEGEAIGVDGEFILFGRT
jgi:hypothetical protein